MAAIVSRLSRSEHETELQALGTRPPQVGTTTWLTELHPLPRHNKNAYRGTYIEEWFDFEGKQDYERRGRDPSNLRYGYVVPG